MKFPHVKQHDERDCGAACLSMISEFYGLKLKIAQFRDLIRVDRQGANIYGIVTGAKKIGLNAEALEGGCDDLFDGLGKKEIEFPFMARIVNEAMFEHYIVVYGICGAYFIVGDPGKSGIIKMSAEQFIGQWQGQIVTFSPTDAFECRNERKGSFRKFFKYITVQKKLLAVIFFVSVFVSLINIFGATIFQYVIDDAVAIGDTNSENTDSESFDSEDTESDGHEHHDDNIIEKIEEKLGVVFANIHTVCISIIMLYLLQFVLRILRGYLLAVLGRRVAVPLTLDYYNHLVGLPIGFYGTRKTGELISRFSDTEKIRDAISTTTLTIMLDTIMAIACGIYLFCMSHLLFAITIVVLALYTVVMFLFGRPIKAVNYDMMESEAQVTSYIKETFDGVETVKAYGYENGVKSQTGKLFGKLVDKIVKGSVIFNVQEALVALISSVGLVVLLWAGAFLCVENRITIGILMTFYYLLDFFLEPVQNLINLQPTIQTAVVAAERLNDILDAETEEAVGTEEMQPLTGDIHFKNIDFRYGNRRLCLKNINMEIQEGKKIAVVGENGCGKTTLVKLLMTFYKPENGEITIGGTNIALCTKDIVRKQIAYISQNVFLFSDSIYNNLKLGDETISDEEIYDICKKCFLDDFIKTLPLGYDTILEENGNNLSGGQKQRLAIARALLRKPDILIMDEATCNLDIATEKNIDNLIDNYSEKMTRIVIAHRMEEIETCDYIYMMEHGEIVNQGVYEELKNELAVL